MTVWDRLPNEMNRYSDSVTEVSIYLVWIIL